MESTIRQACQTVEHQLNDDPSLVFNEAEFQALLQTELLNLLGAMNPIHSQWPTENPTTDRRGRSHDVVIVDNPAVLKDWGKPVSFHPVGFEYELKTSHSDHNWFIRPRGLMDEIALMSEMLKRGRLSNAVAVLFRYGFSTEWDNDARRAMAPYGDVPLYYLTALQGAETKVFE